MVRCLMTNINCKISDTKYITLTKLTKIISKISDAKYTLRSPMIYIVHTVRYMIQNFTVRYFICSLYMGISKVKSLYRHAWF